MTVVHEDSPDSFRVVETVPTQPAAKTMAIDFKTHAVIVASPATAPGAEKPKGKKAAPTGPFTVLILGK